MRGLISCPLDWRAGASFLRALKPVRLFRPVWGYLSGRYHSRRYICVRFSVRASSAGVPALPFCALRSQLVFSGRPGCISPPVITPDAIFLRGISPCPLYWRYLALRSIHDLGGVIWEWLATTPPLVPPGTSGFSPVVAIYSLSIAFLAQSPQLPPPKDRSRLQGYSYRAGQPRGSPARVASLGQLASAKCHRSSAESCGSTRFALAGGCLVSLSSSEARGHVLIGIDLLPSAVPIRGHIFPLGDI